MDHNHMLHMNMNHDVNISDHSMHVPQDHDHSAMSHMHSMSFHFGTNEMVLFNFWVVHNAIGMVATCAITVLMCFIMESIRWFRGIRPPHNVDLHTEQSSAASIKFAPRITTAMCTDSILHAIQLTLSYMLMLLFMTFNVWICIATVLGEVFARLVFAVIFSKNMPTKGLKSVEQNLRKNEKLRGLGTVTESLNLSHQRNNKTAHRTRPCTRLPEVSHSSFQTILMNHPLDRLSIVQTYKNHAYSFHISVKPVP